ncbi:MAG: hypothetical protein IJ757_01010 [Clostridiales bacterium]|nr:hypothetical protein [Clostridiales bacterium]
MANIVLVYEHKAREMESILLIQYELRRRGHNVELFHTHELNRKKYIFNSPDVVVTPFLYGNAELDKYVFETFGRIKRICNLQWEQVYNGTSKQNNKRTPKENAKYATHICWGKNSYNRLMANGCINAKLTGAPHMDFLKKEFRTWYLSRDTLFEKYGLVRNNKTILFISSFSYLGLSDERMEEIKARADFDPYYFRDLTEKSRDIIFSWFEKVLIEQPDVTIVYRPHPGELYDDKIKKMCERFNNMKCIADESVKQWIVACDVILNWYSTAGVEAYFAGKNNIFLRPVPFPTDMEFEMFESVCTAMTLDDFVSLINDENKVEEYYLQHPLGERIAPYYLTDTSLSFVKIADEIERLINSDGDKHLCDKYKITKKIQSHIKYIAKELLYENWRRSSHLALTIIEKVVRLQEFVNYQSRLEQEKILPEDINLLETRIQAIYRDLGRG